ncbi:MAG: amidohydrolase family protein [Novosphingobium sp.]|uniref:amidohydrolase family protein n=1 Tax=Novosphingobium sp. AAP93 TaxID=1523427 RepID=UPI0006B8B011|nr:amidohydrolase family protein [Novosphingobium sp. AAP93]KPF87776.1 amidohydrolase [Novosphingobium sp. AAP93]MBY0393628.1 amidohydrolase family protein [Novosphingobium sp.]
MTRASLFLAALLLSGSALPAYAGDASAQLPSGDFAVTNATVAIGDGSAPIPGGTVLVRGGKIVAAGKSVSVPTGVPVIDGTGKWVTPGLVTAMTDLGLLGVGAVDESNDSYANTARFSAGLDVSLAIDPDAPPVAVSRASGITRAGVAPAAANAIFAGQGAVIDLAENGPGISQPRAFQLVELGERGADLAGGSRVAAQALLRNALREARDLAQRKPVKAGDDAPGQPVDALLTRVDAAALIPVVTGKQPLFVHVERAADIRGVLALGKEFPALRLVLVGAGEGWRVAREIAAAKVPVLASALADLPGSFETLAATQSNVGRMTAAGVKVALGGFYDLDQPRYAPQFAGNLVGLSRVSGASGLSWGQALASITSIPAEILGEGAVFGSLKPGLSGDVVIWDGDPLEVSSAPVTIYVDGKLQPLVNHQSRLRQRYRHAGEGTLPKAYE